MELSISYTAKELASLKKGKHHMNEIYSRIAGHKVNITTREQRLKYWHKAATRRAELGMSVNSYCKYIGICPATYNYWEEEIKNNGIKMKDKIAEKIVLRTAINRRLVESATESYEAKKEIQQVNSNPIFIEIGGARIKVESNHDFELLSKVCTALSGINDKGQCQYV